MTIDTDAAFRAVQEYRSIGVDPIAEQGNTMFGMWVVTDRLPDSRARLECLGCGASSENRLYKLRKGAIPRCECIWAPYTQNLLNRCGWLMSYHRRRGTTIKFENPRDMATHVMMVLGEPHGDDHLFMIDPVKGLAPGNLCYKKPSAKSHAYDDQEHGLDPLVREELPDAIYLRTLNADRSS